MWPGGGGGWPGGGSGWPGGGGGWPGGGSPLGENDAAPTGAPPAQIPQKPLSAGTFALDPGAIAHCRFKFTYIWQRNGAEYWMFITFVGRTSISGWRWMGGRWMRFSVDLHSIEASAC
ncbi:collagen-like protein [Paenibacillus sp. GCM10012303]|uniref:collagen-like protein n=2 Tax=Paenibacillus TaxID=44249 RepID=UPI00361FBEF4